MDRWRDTRLAWNPENYGGVTQTRFNADNSFSSNGNEIWVPDLQPYNAKLGIVHTLEPALALVSSDGDIFFSRPGMIDLMCKFTGLVAFPFDNLGCLFEVGGWSFGGGHQGLTLLNGGYELASQDEAAQEDSAGSSYQEYWISNVTVDTDTARWSGGRT